MKTCSTCGVEKPLTEFSPDKRHRDGLGARCKACAAAYMRGWHARNPDATRARHLRVKFGLSVEQYDAMHAEQNGVCKLCGTAETGGRRLSVDHDHTTGAVRDLCCRLCNTALERLETDPAWTERAAAYLARHAARRVSA